MRPPPGFGCSPGIPSAYARTSPACSSSHRTDGLQLGHPREDGTAGSCTVLGTAGRRAGVFDLACLFPKDTARAGAAGLCDGAYALAGGDIHVVARVKSESVTGAVVGGTGSYVGARGIFTSIERPGDQERNGSPKDDTITLLP